MQTEIIRRTDPCTGDICCRILHQSGLEIRVAEMEGFSTAYAQFGTRFGGIHRQFRCGDDITTLPAGIAHFMEHKLFEKQDGDVMKQFDALGAVGNAYTDFDRTVYHFHTQRHFYEALALLLDFVQTPYFTQETVDRERGIILQELLEALDDPADRGFMQLMAGLYSALPMQTHVLGTAESIAAITPELLYRCHSAFYQPQNMVLCCAGNVKTAQIVEVADRVLLPAREQAVQPLFPQEQAAPAAAECTMRMPVGKTQFLIGFKSEPLRGRCRLRETLLTALTLDLLIGSAAPLYQRLLREGLLNDTFDTDCFAGDGWFTVIAEGESDDPQAVLTALLAEIDRLLTEDADEALFAVLKKARYGDSIIGMNHPEAVCSAMLDAFMWECDSHFDRSRLLAELTPADVQRCLRERFRRDRVCLSVIETE